MNIHVTHSGEVAHEIHIHVHEDAATTTLASARHAAILTAIAGVHAQGERMANELDRLEAAVAKDTTVSESAVTLITGLAAQIRAAGTDPKKLSALADNLEKSSASLAAAVAANTASVDPVDPVDPNA